MENLGRVDCRLHDDWNCLDRTKNGSKEDNGAEDGLAKNGDASATRGSSARRTAPGTMLMAEERRCAHSVEHDRILSSF